MSIGDWTTVASAAAVLLTALATFGGFRAGRGKTLAETELTKSQVRKALAEENQAVQAAQLDAIAGGIGERLDEFEQKLDRIQNEVTPNHGGSMKDAVRRIEESITRDREEQREWRASTGHQLGEIKDQMATEADDRQELDRRAREEHSQLWAAINRVMGRWRHGTAD